MSFSAPKVCTLTIFPCSLAAHAPVVGLDFIDDDHGGFRVLSQDTCQQIRGAFDELCFLICGKAHFGYFDVYIRQVCSLFLESAGQTGVPHTNTQKLEDR